MAEEDVWNIAKQRMLEDRGALLKNEGDLVSEYKAMYEENLVSSWLREDVGGKEERRKEANWMRKDGEDKKGRTMEAERETKKEMGKKRGQEKRRKKRTRR